MINHTREISQEIPQPSCTELSMIAGFANNPKNTQPPLRRLDINRVKTAHLFYKQWHIHFCYADDFTQRRYHVAFQLIHVITKADYLADHQYKLQMLTWPIMHDIHLIRKLHNTFFLSESPRQNNYIQPNECTGNWIIHHCFRTESH